MSLWYRQKRKGTSSQYHMITGSSLCFSGSFNRPLFSPLIPPGVRHFTMEPTRRSISFSLRFSYRFLTGSTYLKGRKIICWVAWRHPSFVINRVLPPKAPETTQNQRIMGFSEILLANTSFYGKAAPLAGMPLINDFSCPCVAP